MASAEPALDPSREIVDPHHHLWDPGPIPGMAARIEPFLIEDMVKTVESSGHNITKTVFVECGAMYRSEGPTDLAPVGETEFANGMAAMSASGRYGAVRIAAGIVAHADLRLGERVEPVLEAHVAAGNGRLRGIRMWTAYADHSSFSRAADPSLKAAMRSTAFKSAVRLLPRHGLSLDVWCFHTQLADVAELAAACPHTTIVLDHVGTPLLAGIDPSQRSSVIEQWRIGILELARQPNVVVKLGGLGMELTAGLTTDSRNADSSTLAAEWSPTIQTCIAAFGPSRCMFESNFPPDRATCSYGTLWNTFKRIVAAYSEDEKNALFSETAKRVYRLG